jgi:hypothetical protein
MEDGYDGEVQPAPKDTRRTFLCLIGEKGTMLLTFFTDQAALKRRRRPNLISSFTMSVPFAETRP